MKTVMSRGGQERLPSFSKRRVHTNSSLKSPITVLSPESPNSSTESSSRASSGEQTVESAIFRNPMRPGIDKSGASFEQVDNYTWFVSIDRPSDLLVEVDDICFHLHKLPLLSRSGLLFRVASHSGESEKAYIKLVDVPGGADAFIQVAKLCYGIVEELTPTNVAAIHCAAKYLEMTEAFEEGNVVSNAEAYIDLVVLNSWQESIIVLQSCELLLPWAEDMHLVKRCSEAVAHKACTDPRGVKWPYSDCEKNLTRTAPRNPLEGSDVKIVPKDWWYKDVSLLTIYCFCKVVAAIKEKSMQADLLGGAVEYYAQRWLPGLVKTPADTFLLKDSNSTTSTTRNTPLSSPRKDGTAFQNQSKCQSKGTGEDSPTKLHFIIEQNMNRHMLEEIVSTLPSQKDAISCKFLFRMLHAANMLDCAPASKTHLERKAGLQLDQGTLSDLLIPSFSHTSEYLYDVDLVRRLLDQFLTQDECTATSPNQPTAGEKKTRGIYDGSLTRTSQPVSTLTIKVAKLLDSYLAEVARDGKLPLAKFQSLAEALPEGSRVCDDGLYRAVDTYLKIHPSLTEHERKKLCRVVDCQRLSLDACLHAVQNERLPLRFVVQVIFCEQLKLRGTIIEVGNSVREDSSNGDALHSLESTSVSKPEVSTDAATAPSQALQEGVNELEVKALQREVAAMRMKCIELERDQTTIQEQVGKISRLPRGHSSSWSSGAWKKISKLNLFSHRNGIESSQNENPTSNDRRWRNSIS